jgi:hypothetical protein
VKLAASVAAAALAAGLVAGWLAGRGDEPETTTVTQTVAAGLPAAVERTRAAIADAARQRDWDALRGLLGPGFKYTFGGPVEGGAIAYWQELEAEQGERPLATLSRVLQLPYTLSRGLYVWPFAYDRTEDDLTAYERGLLAPLGDDAAFVDGYYGWRAGIEPDGDWVFFVAGD